MSKPHPSVTSPSELILTILQQAVSLLRGSASVSVVTCDYLGNNLLLQTESSRTVALLLPPTRVLADMADAAKELHIWAETHI